MNDKKIYLFLILLLSITLIADDYCPGCDRPLKGTMVGGFFGVTAFSVDDENPTTAGEMGLDDFPGWAYTAGISGYTHLSGKTRLGILGGVNWSETCKNDSKIEVQTMWMTIRPSIVRTTSYARISAGMGIGAGMSSLKVTDAQFGVSIDEDTPMFVLVPGAEIELPISGNVIFSLGFSYQWFMGENKKLSWSDGLTEINREISFSPVECGGPTASATLYFGKIEELPE